MTDAVIRSATVADLPACAAIINAYIDATGWLPRAQAPEYIAAAFSPDLLTSRYVLVADRDGEIAGYASFDPKTRSLPALYLSPAARGKGIGKKLLDAVKAGAADGFTLTVWKANRDALRFYLREGLQVAGEDVDDDGLPVTRLTWGGTT
ncbi:GNAT family N-acetyltransferase [Paracoccus sp. (in: a-proteobacteria)]|uniref:GNAT family N-acetyltransferase n=1 Tax=Paracoccus sp. TaxID=267 RepID=UPI003A879C0B